MKYSGSDFKMTSQANHLSKLLQLKSENVRESTHAQRLYKRRKFTSGGYVQSNWSVLGTSTFDDTSVAQPTVSTGSSSTGSNNSSNNNQHDHEHDHHHHHCHDHHHYHHVCDCNGGSGSGSTGGNTGDDGELWEPIEDNQTPEYDYVWEQI